jgi:hypothetical protein
LIILKKKKNQSSLVLINPNFSFLFRFLFLLTLTGDGWLPLQETQTFFVDDPGKLYRQRRRATQAKGLETLDPKAKVEGPSKSPRESPPPSPKEGQPQPPERKSYAPRTSLIYLS